MSGGRVTIPVLKAWNRIFELVHCAEANSFDRTGLEACVLRLFASGYSKSVFRGMAIPTLRNLGFIVGFGDVIRIGANGALVAAAHATSIDAGKRALRAVLVEIDGEIGVLEEIGHGETVPIETLVKDWTPRVVLEDRRLTRREDAQRRAARERVIDWINILSYSELAHRNRSEVRIDVIALAGARGDADHNKPSKVREFKRLLFAGYRRAVAEQMGGKTVEIDAVRHRVAVQAFAQMSEMITERQFDALFSKLPQSGRGYMITLGRSMGADEKLYKYRGKYFQTMSIRLGARWALGEGGEE